MKYDIQLDMLATRAVSELVQAAAENDAQRYRLFLKTSAEFCQSVRESSPQFELDRTVPNDATAFISAVMKISEQRCSERDRDRVYRVARLEPLIQQVLLENRLPTEDEQERIAEMLYEASAADFS